MRCSWERSGEFTQGRPALLFKEIVDDLPFFLSQRPIAYLGEMKWFMWDKYEVSVDVL